MFKSLTTIIGTKVFPSTPSLPGWPSSPGFPGSPGTEVLLHEETTKPKDKHKAPKVNKFFF